MSECRRDGCGRLAEPVQWERFWDWCCASCWDKDNVTPDQIPPNARHMAACDRRQ